MDFEVAVEHIQTPKRIPLYTFFILCLESNFAERKRGFWFIAES